MTTETTETTSAAERYQTARTAHASAVTTAEALTKRASTARATRTGVDWKAVAGWELQAAAERSAAQVLEAELPALREAASIEVYAQHEQALQALSAELGTAIEAAAQMLAPVLAQAQADAAQAGAATLARARTLSRELLARNEAHQFGYDLINVRTLCDSAAKLAVSRAWKILEEQHPNDNH